MTDEKKREAAKKRKAAERERARLSGIKEVRIKMDETERDQLDELCRVRAGNREPYDQSEFVALLIKRDFQRLQSELEALSAKPCAKCGEALPSGCDGLFEGDSRCFLSRHKTDGIRSLEL
ncbi:hypothetical protein [Salinivibrio socompensis]|uniref:hypothetical protein n=1 Tax=Salinivibrio socompensis TaxID=1510206 RepID=UPI000472C1B8|nr:hypothetical protein [Salinivibrio socompensis]